MAEVSIIDWGGMDLSGGKSRFCKITFHFLAKVLRCIFALGIKGRLASVLVFGVSFKLIFDIL